MIVAADRSSGVPSTRRFGCLRLAVVMLLVWLTALGGTIPRQPASAVESVGPWGDPGDLIVRFRVGADGVHPAPTTSGLVANLLDHAGVAAVRESLGLPGAYRVAVAPGRTPAEVAAVLSQSPAVAYVEPNTQFALPASSSQALLMSTDENEQWSLDHIRARDAWRLTDGSSVTVAVLDTGVSPSHPALAGRLLPGWDFVHDDSDPRDDVGHGTFVAGIIAATHGNDGGVAGVSPGVQILPVKILDAKGRGSTVNFVQGIVYAVDSGAHVINISAGGVVDSPSLADAVQYAEDHGVVVVASTGNGSDQQLHYPAAFPQVLAVAASDRTDEVAHFSSTGPYVDVAAPGVGIRSTWWSDGAGDGYMTADGTSGAAPHVAGIAALMLSLQPGLAAPEIRQLITEAAVDIASPGLDAASGFGRIDAYLSARLAQPLPPNLAGEIRKVEDAPGRRLQVALDGFVPGEPVTAWTTSADGAYHPIRNLAADPAGRVTAGLGPVHAFSEGALTVTAVGDQSGSIAVADGVIQVEPAHPAFEPIAPFPPSPDRLYFPETGHSLAYGFKQYWETHGRLAVFGYPISEEFVERNPDTGEQYTVQYFERYRFEYHPEHAGTIYEISLGRLGAHLAPQLFPAGIVAPKRDGRRYFPETGHWISSPFFEYWQSRGALPIFGYPISEAFEEHGRLVQYFERARLEYHPEAPPEHRVLLTRSGVDLARRAGYLTAANLPTRSTGG